MKKRTLTSLLALCLPAFADLSVIMDDSLETHHHRVRISPAFGTTQFVGNWNKHVMNYGTFGVIVDVPFSRLFSAEFEGNYGKSFITYMSGGHDFDLYTLGGNLHLEPWKGGILSPYLGLGMVANGFYNMSYGPRYPWGSYHAWIGSAQGVGGLNVQLSRRFSIGARAEVLVPVFGMPELGPSARVGLNPGPGYEEASAISTPFTRWLVTASLNL